MARSVLVTGVAGSFASLFARRLADLGEGAGISKVVGIDTMLPPGDLGGVKFVRADIRTPVVGKVIAVEDVDTVVHLDVNPPKRGRAGGAKELNVIGTMQLLAACQRSATVTKFVLGLVDRGLRLIAARPGDVHRVTARPRRRTQRVPQGHRRGRVVRPRVRAAASRGHHHDVALGADPAPVDRDPDGDLLLQPGAAGGHGLRSPHAVPDLDDAVAVLEQAILKDRPGTFNVAGDGVVLLSQAARRLGRPIIPLPPIGFAAAARRVLRAAGSDIPPDLHRLLTYGRVVDTTALRDIFGYELTRTSQETFDEFRQSLRPGIMAAVGVRA